MTVKFVRNLTGFAACAAAISMLSTNANATEIRMGGYYHGIRAFVPHQREDHDIDFNGEVLFDSPDWLGWMGSPRPRLGTTIAHHGTSLTYAGLDWTVNVTDAVFFDFGLGGGFLGEALGLLGGGLGLACQALGFAGGAGLLVSDALELGEV